MTYDPFNIWRQRDAANKCARLKAEYGELHEFALSLKTPKELAEWQSKHPVESPQYILAGHEWNRRLIMEQVKWMRWAVYAAVISAILGGIVTYMLPKFFHDADNQSRKSSNSETVSNCLNKEPTPRVNTAPIVEFKIHVPE